MEHSVTTTNRSKILAYPAVLAYPANLAYPAFFSPTCSTALYILCHTTTLTGRIPSAGSHSVRRSATYRCGRRPPQSLPTLQISLPTRKVFFLQGTTLLYNRASPTAIKVLTYLETFLPTLQCLHPNFGALLPTKPLLTLQLYGCEQSRARRTRLSPSPLPTLQSPLGAHNLHSILFLLTLHSSSLKPHYTTPETTPRRQAWPRPACTTWEI